MSASILSLTALEVSLGDRVRLHDQSVPVVIIGSCPSFVTPTLSGGAELFPPFCVSPTGECARNLTESDIDRLIDERVKETPAPLSPILSRLYALHMVLAEIVNDSNTTEADLHGFLSDNPILVEPAGFAMQSEVCLGRDYRIDLLLQFRDVERQILLVELERADIPIFTKKGRPRAQVTHAVQQVEDWLRWWRENPSQIPDGLDPSITPRGAVVIGRTNDLDESTKRRLKHLSLNRDVAIVGYDDLLIRIEGLIGQLETLEEQR